MSEGWLAYASLGTLQDSSGCCIAWAMHHMGMHANIAGRVTGSNHTLPLTRVWSLMLDGLRSPPETARSCCPVPCSAVTVNAFPKQQLTGYLGQTILFKG